MSAQPPSDQAAAVQPPAPERAPLFSFAHEAAPNPTDAVLANAFDQAAKRHAPDATLSTAQEQQDGDPALKPGRQLSPDQVFDEELDMPHSLQEDPDRGFGL